MPPEGSVESFHTLEDTRGVCSRRPEIGMKDHASPPVSVLQFSSFPVAGRKSNSSESQTSTTKGLRIAHRIQ
jgi:hypothetical protein